MIVSEGKNGLGKIGPFFSSKLYLSLFVAFSVLPTLVLSTNVMKVFSSPLSMTFINILNNAGHYDRPLQIFCNELLHAVNY